MYEEFCKTKKNTLPRNVQNNLIKKKFMKTRTNSITGNLIGKKKT